MTTKAQALAVETAEQGLAHQPAPVACPRVPGVHLSVVASTLCAAGIASFMVWLPKQDAASLAPAVPAAPAMPAVPVEAAPELSAPPSVLAAYTPEQAPLPQYEDGLVPLSLPQLAAAGGQAVQVGPAPQQVLPSAAQPQPHIYRGPTLSIDERPSLFPRATSLLGGTTGRRVAEAGLRWLTQEARAAQAHVVQNVDATWAKVWEAGARAQAQALAAAQGRKIDHMVVVCVGHTKECMFGEMKVTYADGKQEIMKYDPLVLDLAGTGFKASAQITDFDLDGDGRPETISELPAGSGLLVVDSDKDGVSGGGALELLSAATDLDGNLQPDGFADGFDALNGLVKKAVREGVLAKTVLTEMRLGAAELKALERSYGLKVRVGGLRAPAVSLAQAGVLEIGLSANRNVRINAFDGRGTDITRRDGADFLRADGTRGEYADLYLSSRRLLVASAR